MRDLIDRKLLLDSIKFAHCNNCVHRKGRRNGKLRMIYEIGDAPCRACDVHVILQQIEYEPQFTIEGYDVDDLMWFAYICRRAGVKESDLRTLSEDTSHMLEIALNDYNDFVNRILEEHFNQKGYDEGYEFKLITKPKAEEESDNK